MADTVKAAWRLWLHNTTISDNRQYGSDMQPKESLEMSLGRQELRSVRHHPVLEISKAVARGTFAQPDQLEIAGNATLVAKVKRAYGASFAVNSQSVAQQRTDAIRKGITICRLPV